jgi:hypothetical protein
VCKVEVLGARCCALVEHARGSHATLRLSKMASRKRCWSSLVLCHKIIPSRSKLGPLAIASCSLLQVRWRFRDAPSSRA